MRFCDGRWKGGGAKHLVDDEKRYDEREKGKSERARDDTSACSAITLLAASTHVRAPVPPPPHRLPTSISNRYPAFDAKKSQVEKLDVARTKNDS